MANSFWPTPQDYNEAIQNPSSCIEDADLAHGVVTTNLLGLPRSMTGAFASVYQLTNADKAWAVRCFLSNRPEQQERYRHISEFVLMDDLECTIDFYYIENGIKIRGEWFPILKMPWVEGDTLDRYVLKNHKNTELMKTLLSDFHKMMDDLARAQISHGDLQHGNILVTPDGLRLVDYDALFVPALASKKSLEVGHPSFQHPERTANHYNKDVDNFSAWLIHAGLLSIAIDSNLYQTYCNGDDNLLFRRADLSNPEESELFSALTAHPSENIKTATTLIRRMLWSDPTEIPKLDASADELSRLPHSKTERVIPTKDDSESELSEPLETQTADSKLDLPQLPQVSDLSWIDEDAAMTRAIAIPEKKPNAWNKVRDVAIAGWDNFHLWFSLYSWVDKNMYGARSPFESGDYDKALKIYSKICKKLEAANSTEIEAYSLCLLRLGCCYKVSATPSLASNYFLLSLQNATKAAAALPAIYLAVPRFQSGDKIEALRLLAANINENSNVSEMLATELRFNFLDRLALFNLLIEYCKQLFNETHLDLAADLIYCSWIVLKSLLKTNSVEPVDQYLDEILDLLALLKNTSKVNRTYEDIASFFAGTKTSNRGAIAYLCTALRDHTDRTKDEPITVNSAIILIAKSNLNKDDDLELLKKSILSVAPPDHVRDILVRLSKELVTESQPDTASHIIKMSFDITAEFSLTPSYEMLSEVKNLHSQVHCLKSVMEDNETFQHLILYLGNTDDHFSLLVSISKFLIKRRKSQELARLFTIVEYGCSLATFRKLCKEIDLPAKSRKEIESKLEKNIEVLAESLKVLYVKKE